MATAYSFTFPAGKRLAGVIALLCLALALGACASGKKDSGKAAGQKQAQAPAAEEVNLAYGASLTLPPSWKAAAGIAPEVADRASLDARRKKGERILLLEAAGSPSPRNLEPMLAVFLVSEDGSFMPREYAEQLRPEEFDAMSKDLLAREKQAAAKNKTPSALLDLQISRTTVAGKFAILQRMLVPGPDGKPVRLINWDVYLPDRAGLAVKSVFDQDVPGAEDEIAKIAQSLRVE